jgi:membrane-bound lytic murein transglycosylase B
MKDRGIAQYVAKEDWVRKKDWPVNVDKRNKNKKYTTYREEEIAGNAAGRQRRRGGP